MKNSIGIAACIIVTIRNTSLSFEDTTLQKNKSTRREEVHGPARGHGNAGDGGHAGEHRPAGDDGRVGDHGPAEQPPVREWLEVEENLPLFELSNICEPASAQLETMPPLELL